MGYKKNKKIIIFIILAFLFVNLFSKNIDLVTLPKRNSVQLTIYNSADITLVKETRLITLKKGNNKVQFSWSGTLIDSSSVEFRPLEHKDEIEILETVFPGQKPTHLIWNIQSEFEGQLKAEVSYFTSGLSWQMDYVAIATPDESKIKFNGYVRVVNNSGEDYENAEIRLIVGKINLVEKIQELATRRQSLLEPEECLDDDEACWEEEEKKEVVLRDSFNKADMAGGFAREEKKIVKEGLSEYFMFSIEGSETVKNGWSKRIRAFKPKYVDFDIVYRMRAHQYGNRPVRFFIWQNDKEHGLGESPLPDGTVRVFKDNKKEGLSFLGEKKVNYVPIKSEIEINLGSDDLIVYQSKKESIKRLNFQFKRHSYNREYVNGWDEEQKWVGIVKNYRDKDINFELHKIWNGDVEYSAYHNASLFDYRTIEAKFKVKANSITNYKYTVLYHKGKNKKQNRIKLAIREIKEHNTKHGGKRTSKSELILCYVKVDKKKSNNKKWDLSWGKAGRPDIIVVIGNDEKNYFRTKVIKNALYKRFDLDTKVRVKKGDTINIYVYDQDLVKNDLIGSTKLKIKEEDIEKGFVNLKFNQVLELKLKLKK